MLKTLYIVIISCISSFFCSAQYIKWVTPKDNSQFKILSSFLAENCRSSNNSYISLNIITKDTFQIITDRYESTFEVGDIVETKTLVEKKSAPNIRIVKGVLADSEQQPVSGPIQSLYPCFWAEVKIISSKPKKAPIEYIKGKVALQQLKQDLKK